MATYNLSILTPEGMIFEGNVESIIAPGSQGSFGVLAHHAPMISALKLGELIVKQGGSEMFFVTGEGILEVTGGQVSMLCDYAGQFESKAEIKNKVAELTEKLKHDTGRPSLTGLTV